MKLAINFISDYKDLTLTPYINIDWTKDTKERGVKTCISIGWLFWEGYIDII